MNIYFHKNFQKAYNKLERGIQHKVDEALSIFRKDPFNSKLRNHALKGHLYGSRAFSVTGDIRIIFEEHENYTVVIMMNVGSHNQVY